MIQILGYTQGNVIAVKSATKFTKSDYEKLLPLLNVKIGQFKKIRLYFEMEDFGAWEDFKSVAKISNELEKIALVGTSCSENDLSNSIERFNNTEIKCFELSEKDLALKWMQTITI